MTGEDGLLTVGTVIQARPCVVTIGRVTDTLAYGFCDSCGTEHVIDRLNFEAGGGPWQASLSGRDDASVQGRSLP